MHAGFLAFADRSTLLGVGFTFVIAGVFLHGFARNVRRSLELRRQHELHVRKLDPGTPAPPLDRHASHLERHLGRYASGVLTLGVLLVIASFFRH